MTSAAVHFQLKIAEDFARHTHTYLLAALNLAKSGRCPPSCLAAVNKACTDAHALWLHVGNVAPLFDQPAMPGPK